MEVFFYILISTFLVSLIPFISALILLLKEEFFSKILLILVAFAAGTLIGSAFLHLLPEAIEATRGEEGSLLILFLYLILGFSFFYILETFIGWHHHHAREHPEVKMVKPVAYLILVSDGIHNFIDGLIIASSYILSFPLGVATTLAVAFHEIPQEVGDIGVLIHSGFKKTQALFFNFFSGVLAVFGGIIGFLLSGSLEGSMTFLLPLAAGAFIYTASSDLIPEIKHKDTPQRGLIYFFIFLFGIALMLAIKLLGE